MADRVGAEIIWKECTGEAHLPGIRDDHCAVCMPYWGSYPVCPHCSSKLPSPTCLARGVFRFYCRSCRKFFFSNRGS